MRDAWSLSALSNLSICPDRTLPACLGPVVRRQRDKSQLLRDGLLAGENARIGLKNSAKWVTLTLTSPIRHIAAKHSYWVDADKQSHEQNNKPNRQ